MNNARLERHIKTAMSRLDFALNTFHCSIDCWSYIIGKPITTKPSPRYISRPDIEAISKIIQATFKRNTGDWTSHYYDLDGTVFSEAYEISLNYPLYKHLSEVGCDTYFIECGFEGRCTSLVPKLIEHRKALKKQMYAAIKQRERYLNDWDSTVTNVVRDGLVRDVPHQSDKSGEITKVIVRDKFNVYIDRIDEQIGLIKQMVNVAYSIDCSLINIKNPHSFDINDNNNLCNDIHRMVREYAEHCVSNMDVVANKLQSLGAAHIVRTYDSVVVVPSDNPEFKTYVDELTKDKNFYVFGAINATVSHNGCIRTYGSTINPEAIAKGDVVVVGTNTKGNK